MDVFDPFQLNDDEEDDYTEDGNATIGSHSVNSSFGMFNNTTSSSQSQSQNNNQSLSFFTNSSFDTSFDTSSFAFSVGTKDIDWSIGGGDFNNHEEEERGGGNDPQVVNDDSTIYSNTSFNSSSFHQQHQTRTQHQQQTEQTQNHFQQHNSNTSQHHFYEEEEEEEHQHDVDPDQDPIVKISLHEEMVCLYNSISRVSSCSLKGKISLQSSKYLGRKPFILVIKDMRYHIENLMINDDNNFVTKLDGHMRPQFTATKIRDKDYVIEVTPPPPKNLMNKDFIYRKHEEQSHDNMQILSYTCPKMLSPVPIVVQNKVRMTGKFCRVAIQIRSNPSNESNLSNIFVLMAVPTCVNGETVKMSRRGGIWDPMKRLIVWKLLVSSGNNNDNSNNKDSSSSDVITSLGIGQTIELQTQFEVLKNMQDIMKSEGRAAINFPVVVRCNSTQGQLSSIKVNAVMDNGAEIPEDDSSIDGIPNKDERHIQMDLLRSFRVLYRKV